MTGLVDEAAFSESLEDVHAAGERADADAGRRSDEPDAAASAKPQPDWVGKKLGNFRLLGALGAGAMGMVIRAQDVHLGRIVALKVLRKQVGDLGDDQRVSQFLREARAAARIEHPNVAHIYEIDHHKGWWYIATELIEGGTLQQIIAAAGPLRPAHACPLIADAASALAVAHQLGIIHRDIKPQNLMLTRSGRCKVVDFGLVRVEDPTDPFDFTKQAVGTPHYIAPEIVARKPPTSAADIYGLGATLYFALAGKPPFTGKEVKAVIRQHGRAPRPDVREANEECTESLAELVKRAMAVDPEERPNATELATILRVENIGEPFDHASLVVDPTGSTFLGTEPGSSRIMGLSGSRVIDASAVAVPTAGGSSAWRRLTRIALAFVLLAAVVGAAWWGRELYLARGGPTQLASPETFIELFPGTPDSYGAPAGTPTPEPVVGAPEFSWSGQRDPDANLFVAHRLGRRFYPLDHADAVLIPADSADFYPSAQAARAAGKVPADPRSP